MCSQQRNISQEGSHIEHLVDLFIKHLPKHVLDQHLIAMSIRFCSGIFHVASNLFAVKGFSESQPNFGYSEIAIKKLVRTHSKWICHLFMLNKVATWCREEKLGWPLYNCWPHSGRYFLIVINNWKRDVNLHAIFSCWYMRICFFTHAPNFELMLNRPIVRGIWIEGWQITWTIGQVNLYSCMPVVCMLWC